MDQLNHDKKYRLALLGLIIIGVVWGLGFPALKYCENMPPFFIMSSRFFLATLVLAIVFHKRLKLIDKEVLKTGVILGILMFGCYIFATVGIQYTTASRTSFFTCLGAICVPLLNFIFFRTVPTKKAALCAIVCVIGIYLISMGDSTDFGFGFGDVICLGASIFGAGQVIAVEKIGGHHDVFALTIIELGTITVVSIIGMVIAGEEIPTSFTPIEIGSIIFISIICSALAFILQIASQKYVPANRVSLLLCLEPVLGGIFSVLLLDEILGVYGYLGGLLVILSIVISETTLGSTNSKSDDSLEMEEIEKIMP